MQFRAGLGVLSAVFIVASTAIVSSSATAEIKRGHRHCATSAPSKSEQSAIDAKVAAFALARSDSPQTMAAFSATVPVYFHIIQDSGGSNVASDEQIAAQITVLNNAYRSAGFTFVSQGTDVVVNDSWFDGITIGSEEEADMKAALHQGGSNALNVYITSPGDGLLGWATFPWNYSGSPTNDGVVILYSSLPGGSAVPYDEGDTLTHEAGHWLGLLHTFESGSAANGCRGSGDRVSDTAAERSPTFSCVRRDSCPQSGVDPIRNFMDYTPDACMRSFSRGQNQRIKQMWQTYRD